jgi:hypothetical protein
MRATRLLRGRVTSLAMLMPVSLHIYPSSYDTDNLRVLLGVIEDAKFKRREALADLAKAASKK